MFAKILHRPALAIVISVVILLLGGLAIKTLPVSQNGNVVEFTIPNLVDYEVAALEV